MEVIDQWVAEFILRRQHNPRIAPINLISALQLGDSSDCINLKVSSVLRDISNSLIRGTIDEGMLDLLEILEKLLLQQHSLLMESHKSAYSWTAAECTLRFMWPMFASDGLFTEALERIWTKRIGILKESGSNLVTHDLLKWETDFNKALEEPELYQRIRESNIRYTAISFLTQLLKEQWALLGSSSLESVAQRRFLKRKTVNVEGDVVDNRGDQSAVDESTRRLESDTVDVINEQRGGEDRNGINRENANDGERMECPENDGIDNGNAADEEHTMGAQEQEHEPSLDKGDKTVARELKDYLLEIQRHIDPSIRRGEEPNTAINHSVDVTPQPTRVNRTGTRGQDHNEATDNVNEKGSDSQGTWSSRIRPRLPTPVPLNVSPLKMGGLAKPHVRRPKKFWTPEEVEALREGVKEYGKSWKDIKNGNPALFAERTEVDLKDKWRNLVGG
ncbi:predicted protein [Arabidopsis lyrata subsp. lyrata]|uniref:Predicted protein n=1 Tax=Arabidopsis lyrata subsp. lyrata TaxID=81972 RepID=D7MPN1_ARALL|nr:uncharacterized protein LOC9302332 isoform X3 [Arabidopsis lyrata subsp. lyrata]XP_020867087.1 uncharacterized protein LOC9302332 isoform X3 [Arabidopsis lyrata subsp. lyrata]XP_020867101.1 uncharacterized protein LOC9302332 isoform X3 [Arabidopsis lyrata subsp. lyrata]EFH40823.1 predicted protein [Arabidopsis lyrata subsp. lyrata]|eukprot:XP_002864564.1 uncharacterized protein LOC9302332 isoform X3 [Arabidopsis lyrata subsp. lyrata]